MNKYLIPIMIFILNPEFAKTQDFWDLKNEKLKFEKKFAWGEDDDYLALKEFKNQQMADKARAGLRGNFGGMATFAIPDKDPNFDYIETNERLGSGTFKEVFLAYRKDLRGNRSEMVVLNKFKGHPGDQLGVFKYYKIFKESDGLMEVYDVFPDKFWYVTKFYNGDLNKFEKLRPQIEYLNQCAYDSIKGLTKLRTQNLYHGDLKPANILFRINSKKEMFCVLADFDSLAPVGPLTKTYAGSVSTPAFVFPELTHKMVKGEKITALDHFKHDAYSTAISLAEFLPFTGENFKESQMILDRIININSKYNSTRSESDYLEWKNLEIKFKEAFKRESQKINKDFHFLKELIIKGI